MLFAAKAPADTVNAHGQEYGAAIIDQNLDRGRCLRQIEENGGSNRYMKNIYDDTQLAEIIEKTVFDFRRIAPVRQGNRQQYRK